MADYINDNELDELNEIYRQKLENQKHHGKKAKASDNEPPKTEKPAKKEKPVKQEKPVKEDKPVKQEKPAKAEKPVKEEKTAKDSGEEENKKKSGYLPHIISISVSAAVFLTVAVLMAVLPRPTESELENRKLTEFPTFSWEAYWSGEFNEQISEYYNDTVPYRDDFKRLGAAFRSLFGINIEGNAIVGPVEQLKPEESAVTTASTKPIVIVTPAPKDDNSSVPNSKPDNSETSAPKPETTDKNETTAPKPETTTTTTTAAPATTPAPMFSTPSDPDAEVLMNEASNIVYNSGGVLHAGTLYNGHRENAEYFAASVAGLKNRINADLYFMPILTQNTFVTPSQLNKGVYTEQADATYLSNLVKESAEVVDIFDTLAAHADEDIFFLRDTHWQQLGAYYAAQQFAKQADVPYPALSEYTKKQRDSIGSIYTFTQYEGLAGVYEDFTYYIPPNEFTVDYYDSSYNYLFTYPLMPENDYSENGFYSLYMVADDYIKHITTDVKNGRKLVVLKDDYLSAAIPCLTSSFEEIFVIDVRHCDFNAADFINEQGATDVLLGLTMSNALGEVGSYIDYLQ